jgi:hypothetical protein
MDSAALLRQPQLSLIGAFADDPLRRIRDVLSRPVVVDGRGDLEGVLNRLVIEGLEPTPKTLDLIGHSTPDRSLLTIGDWVIDGTSSKVLSFFRGLTDCEVWERLGIHAIRLLGCETASSDAARLTIVALADITEVEVFGTKQLIDAGVYDGDGFRADHLLVSSQELRQEPMMMLVKRGGEPVARVFDIDALPASPLGSRPRYPRKIADLASARALVATIRRSEGAQMPGGLVAPLCEIALPSGKPGWWYRVQLLMDGAFVRVFPDGEDRPGVVFPVTDPKRVREIVAGMPTD